MSTQRKEEADLQYSAISLLKMAIVCHCSAIAAASASAASNFFCSTQTLSCRCLESWLIFVVGFIHVDASLSLRLGFMTFHVVEHLRVVKVHEFIFPMRHSSCKFLVQVLSLSFNNDLSKPVKMGLSMTAMQGLGGLVRCLLTSALTAFCGHWLNIQGKAKLMPTFIAPLWLWPIKASRSNSQSKVLTRYQQHWFWPNNYNAEVIWWDPSCRLDRFVCSYDCQGR